MRHSRMRRRHLPRSKRGKLISTIFVGGIITSSTVATASHDTCVVTLSWLLLDLFEDSPTVHASFPRFPPFARLVLQHLR